MKTNAINAFTFISSQKTVNSVAFNDFIKPVRRLLTAGEQYVFRKLRRLSRGVIPRQYAGPGDTGLIDGSLIGAVLSMYWADCRESSCRVRGHFRFDPGQGIPSSVSLTAGKGGERPFVRQILSPGWTGVMDQGVSAMISLAVCGMRERVLHAGSGTMPSWNILQNMMSIKTVISFMTRLSVSEVPV